MVHQKYGTPKKIQQVYFIPLKTFTHQKERQNSQGELDWQQQKEQRGQQLHIQTKIYFQ